MPGEQAWPTQPFPTAPPPFARQSFTAKDLSPFIDDPAELARFKDDIQSARNEGLFTPPGLRNTIEMPGNNGGANFGGATIDPEHGTMFIVSKDFPAMLKLSLSAGRGGRGRGRGGAAEDEQDVPPPAAVGEPQPPADLTKARYRSPFGFMITSSGLSAIAPPWTTFTAYDLNTGKIKWQVPLGEVPELAAKGFTNTGSHFPKVGPVATAGGLIFTGTRDKEVRALDIDTGKALWSFEAKAGLEGMPAIFEVNGKEYVVFCASAISTTHTHAIPGHPADNSKVDGAYIAFALP